MKISALLPEFDRGFLLNNYNGEGSVLSGKNIISDLFSSFIENYTGSNIIGLAATKHSYNTFNIYENFSEVEVKLSEGEQLVEDVINTKDLKVTIRRIIGKIDIDTVFQIWESSSSLSDSLTVSYVSCDYFKDLSQSLIDSGTNAFAIYSDTAKLNNLEEVAKRTLNALEYLQENTFHKIKPNQVWIKCPKRSLFIHLFINTVRLMADEPIEKAWDLAYQHYLEWEKFALEQQASSYLNYWNNHERTLYQKKKNRVLKKIEAGKIAAELKKVDFTIEGFNEFFDEQVKTGPFSYIESLLLTNRKGENALDIAEEYNRKDLLEQNFLPALCSNVGDRTFIKSKELPLLKRIIGSQKDFIFENILEMELTDPFDGLEEIFKSVPNLEKLTIVNSDLGLFNSFSSSTQLVFRECEITMPLLKSFMSESVEKVTFDNCFYLETNNNENEDDNMGMIFDFDDESEPPSLSEVFNEVYPEVDLEIT